MSGGQPVGESTNIGTQNSHARQDNPIFSSTKDPRNAVQGYGGAKPDGRFAVPVPPPKRLYPLNHSRRTANMYQMAVQSPAPSDVSSIRLTSEPLSGVPFAESAYMPADWSGAQRVLPPLATLDNTQQQNLANSQQQLVAGMSDIDIGSGLSIDPSLLDSNLFPLNLSDLSSLIRNSPKPFIGAKSAIAINRKRAHSISPALSELMDLNSIIRSSPTSLLAYLNGGGTAPFPAFASTGSFGHQLGSSSTNPSKLPRNPYVTSSGSEASSALMKPRISGPAYVKDNPQVVALQAAFCKQQQQQRQLTQRQQQQMQQQQQLQEQQTHRQQIQQQIEQQQIHQQQIMQQQQMRHQHQQQQYQHHMQTQQMQRSERVPVGPSFVQHHRPTKPQQVPVSQGVYPSSSSFNLLQVSSGNGPYQQTDFSGGYPQVSSTGTQALPPPLHHKPYKPSNPVASRSQNGTPYNGSAVAPGVYPPPQTHAQHQYSLPQSTTQYPSGNGQFCEQVVALQPHPPVVDRGSLEQVRLQEVHTHHQHTTMNFYYNQTANNVQDPRGHQQHMSYEIEQPSHTTAAYPQYGQTYAMYGEVGSPDGMLEGGLFEDGEELRQHICRWAGCDVLFKDQDELVRHLEKIHIDQRKGEDFTCYWQGCTRSHKPFNARYKLLIHMRVHSGEKPNKCTVGHLT